MFQSKEHLIRSSDPSLWGFAGLDPNEEHNHKVSTRVWNALNSKLFNALIVVLVLIDAFVIISQTMIDSNWIRDPMWRSWINCTDMTSNTNTTTYESFQLSPTLLRAKHIFTYISLTIIWLFFIEVLLRIYSGKSKLFVEPFELLDAILVNIVFTLSLVFYFHNSRDKTDGKQSSVLIVLLRLWRVFKIIKLLIEESQQRILQTLSICEKEKTHCEHKIDILILKVEDLEHEVAYLKEKLKKSEKDNSAYIQQLIDAKPKKVNAKRTQSSQSYCPCRKDSFKNIDKPQIQSIVKPQRNCAQINYTFVSIESQPLISKPVINEFNEKVVDLDVFAKNLAQSITIDVMNAVFDKTNYNSINNCIDKSEIGTKALNALKSQSNKISPSPNRWSHRQHFNDSLINSSLALNNSHIHSGLYLISDQSNHSEPNQSKMTAHLDFESSSAAQQLNEESDIERIGKAEFNINNRDIPLSSL